MPLVYSKQLPSRSGWYWLKEGNSEWVIKVDYENDELMNIGYELVLPLSTIGEWAGPIDKPLTQTEYLIGGYIT